VESQHNPTTPLAACPFMINTPGQPLHNSRSPSWKCKHKGDSCTHISLIIRTVWQHVSRLLRGVVMNVKAIIHCYVIEPCGKTSTTSLSAVYTACWRLSGSSPGSCSSHYPLGQYSVGQPC